MSGHNVRGWDPDRTDPEWAERVERQAEQHTARTEAAWHKAQRRLARATEKAEAAVARAEPKVRVDKLWRQVEVRRQELKALERLAQRSPAGSENRGRTGYRGVGRGDVL